MPAMAGVWIVENPDDEWADGWHDISFPMIARSCRDTCALRSRQQIGEALVAEDGQDVARVSPQPLDDLLADSTLSPHANDCCPAL